MLKRLKLSGIVPIRPDRAAYAQKASLGPLDFPELTNGSWKATGIGLPAFE